MESTVQQSFRQRSYGEVIRLFKKRERSGRRLPFELLLLTAISYDQYALHCRGQGTRSKYQKESEKLFARLLRHQRQRARVISAYTALLLHQDRIGEAQQVIENARRTRPRDLSLQLSHANILSAQGSYNQAQRLLRNLMSHPAFRFTGQVGGALLNYRVGNKKNASILSREAVMTLLEEHLPHDQAKLIALLVGIR